MRINRKYKRYTEEEKKALIGAISTEGMTAQRVVFKKLSREMGRDVKTLRSAAYGLSLPKPLRHAKKEGVEKHGSGTVEISVAGVILHVPKGASVSVANGKLQVAW
jgi:hypothetical protein